MRRNPLVAPQQRPLPFARHELWERVPAEQRQQCRQLCEDLLRTVLQHEARTRNEEEDTDDREDPR